MPDRTAIKRFEDIPNIGPEIAQKLRLFGLETPDELADCDAYELFEELNLSAGVRHDPCLLDVFISAVAYLNGAPSKPWWAYTEERKQRLA